MARETITRRAALRAAVAVGVGGAATSVGGSGPARAAPAPAARADGPLPEMKLLAGDGDDEDRFGQWVSLDGSTAVVGAPADDNENGENAGAAYVFERADGSWTQQAKLTADDGAADDQFGTTVALDGSTAVVGATGDDRLGGEGAGSAYAFERADGSWTQQAKLRPVDGTEEDSFGVVAALDGSTALVGAWTDSNPNGENAGAAYVFDGSDGEWTERAKLTAEDGDDGDRFGAPVTLDGSTAVVGATGDEDPNGSGAGAAYVFTRSGSASDSDSDSDPDAEWRQRAKLAPDDGDTDDDFGRAVAIDGERLLVGAPGDDDPNGEAAGSAYVFEGSGEEWDRRAKLAPEDGDRTDLFGFPVSLDGETALIGAPGEEDPNGDLAGAAYVFDREGLGLWRQRSKLAPEEGESEDRFGIWSDLDGERALVGAYNDSNANGVHAGSVYVYDVGEDGPVSVRLGSSSPTIPVDGSRSFDLVAVDADDGASAYDLTLAVDDTSVARLDSVSLSGSPGVSNVSVADDGASATLQVAGAGLTSTDDSVVLATVSLAGVTTGEADLDVTVAALGDRTGTRYESAAGGSTTLSVVEGADLPAIVGDSPPTDVDGDGLFEDVDGDGEFDVFDVQAFLEAFESETVRDNASAFDFDGSGDVSIFDVQSLLEEL